MGIRTKLCVGHTPSTVSAGALMWYFVGILIVLEHPFPDVPITLAAFHECLPGVVLSVVLVVVNSEVKRKADSVCNGALRCR